MKLSRKAGMAVAICVALVGLLVGINASALYSDNNRYSYDFSDIQSGIDSIRAEEFQETISFLAAPRQEGRRSGTFGSFSASFYIADSLASSGFSAFNGDYFQRFDLRDVQEPDFPVE